MKTVCAWCGEHMAGDKEDPQVSHGICPKCLKEFEEENDLEVENAGIAEQVA